jgi:hypothetical protein
MISKKRRHKGILKSAPPTTGRAAFKGILHPLILGGQSVAPSSTATTANFDPYSQATVTVPSDAEKPSKINVPCELSATERAWCDINPTFSWCNKAGLFADDPKCIPNNIKCPPSQKWLDISKDPRSTYADFTREENIMNGINGMCVDEAIAETEAKAKKAYDDWVNTRGCKVSYNDLGYERQQNYARCPDEFKDAKLGDIRSIDLEISDGFMQDFSMRLLAWIPDKPSFVPDVVPPYVPKS